MRRARQIKRRIDEAATRVNDNEIPEDVQCLVGACGPYIASDRAEFHHGCKEAQEWWVRLDAEEVRQLRYSIALGRFVELFLTWTKRGGIAFAGALSAVYAFGEKLGQLPEMMLSAASAVPKVLSILRGWFGG